MTAVVMEDVNTCPTLDCAHRRRLLAALNGRSLSVTWRSFPRTMSREIVYIHYLLSDAHVASSPIEVLVAMLYTTSPKFLRMGASLAVHSRDSFREDAWLASQGHLDFLLKAEIRSCLSRCSSLLSAYVGCSCDAS